MIYLSANQVAQYAYHAGFRGKGLVTAVAIADAESTFDAKAVSPSDRSLGLWQIGKGHDKANPSALLNPKFNAKMAYSISDHGTDWSAWRTYTNGSYKKFWNVAQAAAQTVATVATTTYPHLDVDVNGQTFPAIAVHNETYLKWTVLKKWGIPYKYLGNGRFSFQGQTVKGVVYKNDTYLPWTSFSQVHVAKTSGTFNFSISNKKAAQFSTVHVKVDGRSFPAIFTRNSVYLLWTALKKWDIPHKYLGNGKFSIKGRLVEGVVYKGNTYIFWGSIPGIKATKVNGGFNFTDSL